MNQVKKETTEDKKKRPAPEDDTSGVAYVTWDTATSSCDVAWMGDCVVDPNA